MWKLAISQLRTHPRRYVAVLLAITLGTMFLAGALLVTSSAKETTKQLLGATYANADLLISAETEVLGDPASEFFDLVGTPGEPGSLANFDAVAEIYPVLNGAAVLVLPDGSEHQGTYDADADFVALTNRSSNTSLLTADLVEGTLPATDRQITLDAETAQRHAVTPGDTVTLRSLDDETEYDFTLSGVVETSMDPTRMGAMTAYTTSAALTELDETAQTYTLALMRAEGDLDGLLTDIQTALDAAGIPATVNTPDVQVSEQLVDALGFDAITVVLGGFSAIALLVMMLVVNNTFSVLVAQRTRQYALQRVLGATRGQIRRSVVAEGLLIGLLGSILGILAALGLMAGLITLAQRWLAGATLGIDASLGWVLVTGVGITLAALWFPAAQATRVSPLQAMQPVPTVTVGSKAGTLRLLVGAVAVMAGAGAMVVFAFRGEVGPAILTGAISFVGVLMLGALFVPGAVYGLGWLTRLTGVSGKMAQRNAVRHPSRTAATATALIIGTTLVALILTGGRTAQQHTDDLLVSNYPVDLYAELTDIDPTDTAQVQALTEQLEDTDGIAAAQELYPVGTIEESWADHVMAADLRHLPAVTASLTVHDAQALQQPGTVLVPEHFNADTLTVTTAQHRQIELDAVRSSYASVAPVVSADTAALLGAPVGPAVVWLAVTDPAMSTAELQELIAALASDAQLSAQDVSSPLVTRGVLQQAIDAVMLTVIGLLGISVLIAFVGVANTLALSSLERTRENALLRTLGMTQRGLRVMLMWEAILISAIGAILGSALGMFYGWAGAQAIFAHIAPGGVTMSWPLLELGLVVGLAVLAGLIASVAPSRRAAKASPVVGLAA